MNLIEAHKRLKRIVREAGLTFDFDANPNTYTHGDKPLFSEPERVQEDLDDISNVYAAYNLDVNKHHHDIEIRMIRKYDGLVYFDIIKDHDSGLFTVITIDDRAEMQEDEIDSYLFQMQIQTFRQYNTNQANY